MRGLMGFTLALCVLVGVGMAQPVRAQSLLSEGYAAGDAYYNPTERAGREIWFYATAFNDRFFTYSYPQRLGAAIDWYKVLGAPYRDDLFQAWGAIPDPDCCVPGAENCPATSLEETYGMLWCPGDDELLKFVGKDGYRDPACDFQDSPFPHSTPHGSKDQRQSVCDLKFGTSTGALGLRKFPNPNFDAAAWSRLNGSAASWDGYRDRLSSDPADPDSRATRLFDGSIEPPFRIGMACGACHIAYDPLNPPDDPDNPAWENIKGLVGNQYSRVSNMLGSGMPESRLEWQLVARARPGVVDTSALPMDQVSNPGTMNALINIGKRPVHEHSILKWRKAASCAAKADPAACWCEPGKPGKCWERSLQTEMVPNILKGGEDSIGVNEAIQRVYFNIGSCAEQCWLNHIPDLRAADPSQRNYGHTPFDIGQCRRDCASFRAIEDRLDDVKAFFLAERPTDLWAARGLSSPRDLEIELEQEFGEVRGRDGTPAVYRAATARAAIPASRAPTRTSISTPPTRRIRPCGSTGWATTCPVPGERDRHLSRPVPCIPTTWKAGSGPQYASVTLLERASADSRPEIMRGGGRGYYRNISLLSDLGPRALHAQQRHRPGALRPATGAGAGLLPVALRGRTRASPLPTRRRPAGPSIPACLARYELYKASMEALLNPAQRMPKM